jgi:hypothetical protein
MFRNRRLRRLLVAATAIALLGGVSLVYAAWLTEGSGSGYAKAGEAQDLSTLDVAASVTTLPNQLYPGADGDVAIQIHNPNEFPVRVTQLAANGPITASGGIGTCTTTGVTFDSPQTVAIDVQANGDSAVTTLTNAAHMSNASENGCQNATFTIPVTLTGSSQAP